MSKEFRCRGNNCPICDPNSTNPLVYNKSKVTYYETPCGVVSVTDVLCKCRLCDEARQIAQANGYEPLTAHVNVVSISNECTKETCPDLFKGHSKPCKFVKEY